MKEILKISYDNTTEEIEEAYKNFQNYFLLKKKIIYTVIYLIVLVLAADLVIRDNTNVMGYAAGGLALGIMIFNWVKPVLIRRKMINTLSQLGTDETYMISLFEDRVEVETVITPEDKTETVAITRHGVFPVEEGSEAAKELEEHPELIKDETQTEKSVYRIAETELLLRETPDLLILYVNRALFHTIPKRCLGTDELLSFKSFFEERAMI